MRKLLIRSAGKEFPRVLEMLQKNKGDVIDVLVTPSFDEKNLAFSEINKIYKTDKERISRGSISSSLFRELRGNKYDEVIVLYNIKERLGYENVEKLALCIKPKKVIGINSALEAEEITRIGYFKKRISSLAYFFWYPLNFAAFFVTFCIALIGIILVEPLIFLTRRYELKKDKKIF